MLDTTEMNMVVGKSSTIWSNRQYFHHIHNAEAVVTAQ